MSATELKGCPFCGGPAVVLNMPTGSHRVFWVNCDNRDNCDAPGPHSDSEQTARDKWNTRPAEDAIRLKTELYERTRERDEAKARAEELAAAGEQEADLLYIRERNDARHERDAAIARAEKAEQIGVQLRAGLAEVIAAAREVITRAEQAERDRQTAQLRAEGAIALTEKVERERDDARAEVGRLVEQLTEVTGRLTLAEVEVGRLRGALDGKG